MAGTFIVFEGGEGSGKDTLINFLKEKLADRKDVVYTRAPGGTPVGEQLRDLLLTKKTEGVHPRTELLLFLAAHTELIEKVILPALSEGKLVVSNRYVQSLIAYQIYGRQQEENLMLMQEAIRFITHGIEPDICFFLNVDPALGIERTKHRAEALTRFDEEELAFHQRVLLGYKKHLGQFAKKTVTIDTSGASEDAWKKTEEALQSFL